MNYGWHDKWMDDKSSGRLESHTRLQQQKSGLMLIQLPQNHRRETTVFSLKREKSIRLSMNSSKLQKKEETSPENNLYVWFNAVRIRRRTTYAWQQSGLGTNFL